LCSSSFCWQCNMSICGSAIWVLSWYLSHNFCSDCIHCREAFCTVLCSGLKVELVRLLKLLLVYYMVLPNHERGSVQSTSILGGLVASHQGNFWKKGTKICCLIDISLMNIQTWSFSLSTQYLAIFRLHVANSRPDTYTAQVLWMMAVVWSLPFRSCNGLKLVLKSSICGACDCFIRVIDCSIKKYSDLNILCSSRSIFQLLNTFDWFLETSETL